jgi:hypothetical protein
VSFPVPWEGIVDRTYTPPGVDQSANRVLLFLGIDVELFKTLEVAMIEDIWFLLLTQKCHKCVFHVPSDALFFLTSDGNRSLFLAYTTPHHASSPPPLPRIQQLAMNETFLLTNIAPQVGDGFNRHYWAYLEDFCRRLTGSFEDVYVFT